MNFKRILMTAVFCGLAMTASAQTTVNPARAINTGGQAGAYYNTFCPPIPGVLANAYFQGYQCATSAGTGENIQRVLRNPTSLGFVQFDAYALATQQDPTLTERLSVVRTDIACEGLWMITRNPELDFGRVLGLARRIQWVLPPENSGSVASFNYLREIDPEGLGRTRNENITYAPSATDVIRNVANSTDGRVGFFVQFADPRNPNIKLMAESQGLRVIPVISREILRARVGDQAVYSAQTFALTPGGWTSRGRQETTACTQVAIVTGNPQVFPDRNGQDDAREMIQRVQSVNREALLPRDSTIASILRSARALSQQAIDSAVAAVEQAKAAARE